MPECGEADIAIENLLQGPVSPLIERVGGVVSFVVSSGHE